MLYKVNTKMKVVGWQEQVVFVEANDEKEAAQKTDEGRFEKGLRIAGDFEMEDHLDEEQIDSVEEAREDDPDYKNFKNFNNKSKH